MSAIYFVVLLVLTTIAGAGVLVYAAHVFVTIAQQTAGGLDDVAWTKDPWYDWIGKAIHILWLVVFWLVPLGLLLRVIGPNSLAASVTSYVGVPAALFWLIFPVTLVSSFSAGSPWVLFRAEALGRMARGASATFGFFLLTAPLCLAGGAALYFTLAESRVYALPVLATVLFLYARLIGRYSRLLGRLGLKHGKPKTDPEVRRAAKSATVVDPWDAPEEEATKQERPRKKKKKKPAAKVHDPWAVPDEPAEAEAVRTEEPETYGVAKDEAAPHPADHPKPPPVEGYEVGPAEPPTPPTDVPLDGSPPIETRVAASEVESPLPAWPLIQGVFTFPWYPSQLPVWVALTLMFLGWAYLYSVMQEAAGILK
jgi:hypothetical protein